MMKNVFDMGMVYGCCADPSHGYILDQMTPTSLGRTILHTPAAYRLLPIGFGLAGQSQKFSNISPSFNNL
jgi:hypothetical protein